MKIESHIALALAVCALGAAEVTSAPAPEATLTYQRFEVHESDGHVLGVKTIAAPALPRWARSVSQQAQDWLPGSQEPRFDGPIPFVIAPEDPREPFYGHNHQPSITWLSNGDLLAIWYSTISERGDELTVLASRFRAGAREWEPSSEFFKAARHNMHGSSVFHDGQGKIYHFNGMGPVNGAASKQLVLLLRTSYDNGVTWTPPRLIGPRLSSRHQVISGTLHTADGTLIQCCDAREGLNDGTALRLSTDEGASWFDPGEGKVVPRFTAGGTGEGIVAGIHAAVVELNDGRLMALGRGATMDERMPMSVSRDRGRTWTYTPSPFPPIGGGQRLALIRLREGPLLLVSFTSGRRRKPLSNGMLFQREDGTEFIGHGMFAALSFDDGETWTVRKLLTPGNGHYDGGAHTGPFTATPTRAEHAGYLAATQSPDGTVHLISSRLHYRFNLPWLQTPAGLR